jgi:hypothetical protein
VTSKRFTIQTKKLHEKHLGEGVNNLKIHPRTQQQNTEKENLRSHNNISKSKTPRNRDKQTNNIDERWGR